MSRTNDDGQSGLKSLLAGIKRVAVVPLFYWLNNRFPKAKELVPRRLRRFVLLRIVDVNRGYEKLIRTDPSRLFLEHKILPWVRDNYRRVLFVGTAPYTFHYENLFKASPDDLTTIDKNPGAQVWGSRQHIVGPIQDVGQHRPPGFFDAVILNGILGYKIPELDDYGVFELDDMRNTMRVLHGVIRPGGMLVVGWKPGDLPKSPYDLGVMTPWFEPHAHPEWGKSQAFSGEVPHVYELYIRRATPTPVPPTE